MQRYTIRDSGQEYLRITKAEARKRYERGERIDLCPNKLRPGFPWAPNMTVCKAQLEDRPFDKMVSEFEYYNCSHETGYYTAFYRNPLPTLANPAIGSTR